MSTTWWDADIQQLQLADHEKAGLQVYRNYSKAFLEAATKRFVAAQDERLKSFDYSPFENFLNLIASEDQRYLLILVCSFADEQLVEMFEREVPFTVPGGRASMLTGFGALSRLSQRIQIAYSFGLLSADLLEQIDRLRRLRNDVSHKWNQEQLTDKIASLLDKHLHPVEEYFVGTELFTAEETEKLSKTAKLRVRLAWLVGRMVYETQIFPATIRERLPSQPILYGKHHPKFLGKIARLCEKTTRQLKVSHSTETKD